MKIKNPLKVNENDTIGTAALKGVAEGYVKTTFAGLVGLGVLSAGYVYIASFADNSEEEEVNNELYHDDLATVYKSSVYNELYEEYLQSNIGETYTEWLESKRESRGV